MYQQLDLFSFLNPHETSPKPEYKRLNVGDRIGRIVLGEVEIGTIYKVEGNEEHFFYRTDKGVFDKSDRTDFEQMEREAEEIRKRYKTIEIDHFDKFFAVRYPPRNCDGYRTSAMVGVYKDMLFWKGSITYQFLGPVKNLEKAYKDKVFKITHNDWDKSECEYEVLDEPIPVKRLYYSNMKGCYAEARFVKYNP